MVLCCSSMYVDMYIRICICVCVCIELYLPSPYGKFMLVPFVFFFYPNLDFQWARSYIANDIQHNSLMFFAFIILVPIYIYELPIISLELKI